jgi:deoxyribodipyrimidine photo-lyase
MKAPITILWFRLDLRLADNPALLAAIARKRGVIPVFIWAPEEEGKWVPGAASRWWLHQSLASLSGSLRAAGSRLIIRTGPSIEALRRLIKETGASAVYWNRRFEPRVIARDAAIEKALRKMKIEVRRFNSALLFEPESVLGSARKPYQVFTPFWKSCLAAPEVEKPMPAPRRIKAPATWPASIPLEKLHLEPKIDWARGIRKSWKPGEKAARARLRRFVKRALAEYSQGRDCPARLDTSRLSPYLHFGELGPRQVWHAVKHPTAKVAHPKRAEAANVFLRQLVWREFAFHLLFHFPHTHNQPLRSGFARFHWSQRGSAFKAWQRGRTGYPLVDAGMRELWTTGWMHNRVRMVVASFLVKDLLIAWQKGAEWFWDTLVDADLANNTLGWQWVAGCGADAAPYFRIFNPVRQSRKIDPRGDYIRRWVPELAKLPLPYLHEPCTAPAELLRRAGVTLGKSYPRPIVNHDQARQLALAAYDSVRR